MSTTGVYPPSDEFVRKAHVKGMEGYRELYRRAEQDPEAFWGDIAEREIHWFEKWTQVLDWKPPFARWFVGAKTNVSYNCLDRHAASHRKNKVAILWEGEPGEQRTITYQELHPLGFTLRERTESARLQGRRPRDHLHADDSGAAHRHAGVRAAGDHA